MNTFDGFPAAGLSFLTSLGMRDKAWFDDNRTGYQSNVVKPAKAFVVAMGEAFADGPFPLVEAVPKVNGSMTPINNDLRFSPDAPPYKDHLTFKFWEGPDKKIAPTLWIRLHPVEGIGFASGVVIADLDRWRSQIDNRGEALAAAIDALEDAHGAEVAAAGLKRVPKPYDADHPREALLRAKGFQVRWVEPTPPTIGSPQFVDFCVGQLERLAPVHRWLTSHLL